MHVGAREHHMHVAGRMVEAGKSNTCAEMQSLRSLLKEPQQHMVQKPSTDRLTTAAIVGHRPQ